MRLALTALALLATALGTAAAGLSGAVFTSERTTPQPVGAVPDFTAPAVVAATAVGEGGGAVGPGQPYRVYADVADGGNPPSGVASVRADVSALTPGATAAPLAAGSFEVAGQAYSHRSQALMAGAGLADGPRPFTIATEDGAGNAGVHAFTATVDGMTG